MRTTTTLFFSLVLAGGLFAQSVTPPYVQSFSAPLGAEWLLQPGGTNGRIQLTQNGSVSPLSGGNALVLDTSVTNPTVTNSAILRVNLNGLTSLSLTYWFKETADENHAEDGVFLSDGVVTVQLTNHQNGPSVWTEFSADVGAAALSGGLNVVNPVQLIFRQRDNAAVPSDGAFIDDVRLTLPDTGQANRANAYLDINGGTNLAGQAPDVGVNGPFFASGNTISMTVQGPPGAVFVMAIGPLNRNHFVIPVTGSVDLGFAPDLSDIGFVMNGLTPSGFFDQFAAFDSSGTSLVSFGAHVFPPGILGTFQGAVLDGGSLYLTSAVQFTVTP